MCIEHCILKLLLQPDDIQQCAFRLVLVHQCGAVAALYLCTCVLVPCSCVLVQQCGVVAAWAFQVFSLIVFPPRGERGEVEGKTSQVFLILWPSSYFYFLEEKKLLCCRSYLFIFPNIKITHKWWLYSTFLIDIIYLLFWLSNNE